MNALSDDLERQLLALFVAEAGEHLQAISRGLLELEARPAALDAASLAGTMREAHSLKGAARAVNLGRVEALAHQLESLFARLQSGQLQIGPAVFALAYRALDLLGAQVRAAGGQAAEPPAESGQALLAEFDVMLGAAASPAARPEPPPAALPQTGTLRDPGGAADSVRVSTIRLDALLARMGELQVNRIGAGERLAELRRLEQDLAAWEAAWRKTRPHYRRLLRDDAPAQVRALRSLLEFVRANETCLRALHEGLQALQTAMQSDAHRLAQAAADLDEEIRQTRLLPVSTVFNAFPRMVRDLAASQGKQVNLVLQGSETSADRVVLDKLRDPLMHLLRNCVDHGVESPALRRAAGKPPQALITLHAAQHGSSLVLEVSDDGAGIDLPAVRTAAVRAGQMSAEAAAALGEREALWLIFSPGLSTSRNVSEISGRGVGLDVVRQRVEELRGLIEVSSQPGQGTRFNLRVPLSVATTLCVRFQAGLHAAGRGDRPQDLALPASNVVRLLRVDPAALGSLEGRPVLRVDGEVLPLYTLTVVLGLPPLPARPKNEAALALLLGSAEKRVVFVVDAVLEAQELIVQHLPPPLLRVRHTAGAAILSSGAVLPVLDPADLLHAAEGSHPAALPEAPASQPRPLITLLVADDSITTRTLEKNILETAGYRVRLASDGLEALSLLQEQPCDLLVSDVMMPRLNGFELCARLRADPKFKNLPIVLVTSLDSPAEREQGIRAGADAYIIKGTFDQENLLETIRGLV